MVFAFSGSCLSPIRLAAVVVAAACLVGSANAQVVELDPADPAQSVRDLLSGGSEREWVLSAFSVYLGNDRCDKGERYRFKQDGTVSWDRCMDGRIQSTEQRWQVRSDAGQDPTLIVDEAPYLIRFRQREGGMDLLLRQAAEAKSEETTDRILTWLEE